MTARPDPTTPASSRPTTFPTKLTRLNSTRSVVARSDIREPVHRARTVADLFNGNAHVSQNGHVEVRQRRSFGITDVTTASDPRRLAADERNRQIVVEV